MHLGNIWDNSVTANKIPTNFMLYYTSLNSDYKQVFNQIHWYFNETTTDYQIFKLENLFTAEDISMQQGSKVDFTNTGSNLIYSDIY